MQNQQDKFPLQFFCNPEYRTFPGRYYRDHFVNPETADVPNWREAILTMNEKISLKDIYYIPNLNNDFSNERVSFDNWRELQQNHLTFVNCFSPNPLYAKGLSNYPTTDNRLFGYSDWKNYFVNYLPQQNVSLGLHHINIFMRSRNEISDFFGFQHIKTADTICGVAEQRAVDRLISHTYWNLLDYIYVTSQKVWSYDLITKFNIFNNWLHDNNFSITFEILFSSLTVLAIYELFLSLILDNLFLNLNYFSSHIFIFNKQYISILDQTLFVIYHPESIFLSKNSTLDLFLKNTSSFHFVFNDALAKYSVVTPIHFMLQIIFIFFIVAIFITFFFSFFSRNKEEWQDDINHSVSNLSVEAEKELGAIDDIVYLFCCALFIFTVYFGFFLNFFNVNLMENSFFVSLWPIFILVILFIPLNLLFDFGLFFLVYLRGSAKTSSIIFEWIYDWMGIIAFFTRIVVQFVRQILILVVYLIMHDTVVLQIIPSELFLMNDNFWSELTSIQPTFNSISYFFFIAFPMRVLYWIYEVLHTFFVATGQFAAFFTIVFWLFLLLYTSFIFLKYEHHFDNLNKLETDVINDLKKLK